MMMNLTLQAKCYNLLKKEYMEKGCDIETAGKYAFEVVKDLLHERNETELMKIIGEIGQCK